MDINFLDIVKAVIFGFIEGITEWLPISSTGHLILADEFLKLSTSDSFKSMFDVVIQLGAIMAVVVLYFNKLNPLSKDKSKEQVKSTMELWYKVIVACLPATAIGLVADDWLDEHLFNPIVVAIMLILYGILFIVIEARNNNKNIKPVHIDLDKLSYKTAFLIGLFQVLALIPGTSRSGATIIGGMLVGASRYVATEFTFFLAIPVMFGASLLKIVKFGFEFSGLEIATLLTGMISSFIVSVIAIKFLISYVKKNDFKAFGYYRIIIGVLVLVFYFTKYF